MSAPRLRFAPAPTGYLHVGSARSALFNWLYARHTGGELVLRIEDTDEATSQPELIDNILRSLEWLGIDWDEGPILQSGRKDLYADAIDGLVSAEAAYEADGAIWFRVPPDGATVFEDVVRGEVRFEHTSMDDFVVRRSDGSATFVLANAVDDVDLGITHVVRGEDLLNPTPQILLIRQALGHTEQPVWAHLPLIVNEQRKKLSKRRDDVALEDYIERGYLAEAMANYLATLGWGPPDEVEVRPISEIVELFELTDVNSSAAQFDLKKLDAFNGEWIRGLSVDDFVERSRPWLPDHYDVETYAQMASAIQPRATTLAEGPPLVDFLFTDDVPDDPDSWHAVMADDPLAAAVLDDSIERFASVEWSVDALHAELVAIGEAHDVKLRKSQAPVRIAVTGRRVGPPLFESLVALGRERTLDRLRVARARL